MSPQRIQLRRTKGWRKPEGAIVVARPTKWGNPWRIRRAYNDGQWEVIETTPDLGDTSIDYAGTPEEARSLAVDIFRNTLTDEDLTEYPGIETIRTELGGRDLACWCPLDQPCHADILLEIANPGRLTDPEGTTQP